MNDWEGLCLVCWVFYLVGVLCCVWVWFLCCSGLLIGYILVV